MSVSAGRRLRADAQRNYDAIVTAAGEAFARAGTQASLDDIAVRAGVGNATLYRHFPSRDALLVAALKHRLAELDEQATELERSTDPGSAIVRWFFLVSTHLRTWSGLPDSVVQALRNDASPLTHACQPLQESTRTLIGKAMDAGAIRRDLDPDDAFTIVAALAWAADQRGDTDDDLRRMIGIVLTGMR